MQVNTTPLTDPDHTDFAEAIGKVYEQFSVKMQGLDVIAVAAAVLGDMAAQAIEQGAPRDLIRLVIQANIAGALKEPIAPEYVELAKQLGENLGSETTH